MLYSSPRVKGHRLSVPSATPRPMTSAISTPKVMASWLKVPHKPRRATGEISDRYRGATPELIPGKINPKHQCDTPTSFCHSFSSKTQR